jgi:hypothetical protein
LVVRIGYAFCSSGLCGWSVDRSLVSFPKMMKRLRFSFTIEVRQKRLIVGLVGSQETQAQSGAVV